MEGLHVTLMHCSTYSTTLSGGKRHSVGRRSLSFGDSNLGNGGVAGVARVVVKGGVVSWDPRAV